MTTVARANGSMRRRTLLATAIAAAGLGLASTAAAQAWPVGLQVIDRETGRELPVWRHHGRLFVAGRPGARYGLRASNHTGGRVLLVLSVDGVNVLTGETASYDQRGYVLDAHDSYDVTGWRKSNAEVAAFNFASLPQSYAARTGRPGEVGVIGMAVFTEKAAPPERDGDAAPARSREVRRSPSPMDVPAPPPLPIPATKAPMSEAPATTAGALGRAAPSIASAQRSAAEAFDAQRRDEKLGTAHGARETSVISLTSFVRATTRPQSTRQIEYDTYSNLVARGVVREPPVEHWPRPFPQEPDPSGFVPDPPFGR